MLEAYCATAVFMYHVACALNRVCCNQKLQKIRIRRQLKVSGKLVWSLPLIFLLFFKAMLQKNLCNPTYLKASEHMRFENRQHFSFDSLVVNFAQVLKHNLLRIKVCVYRVRWTAVNLSPKLRLWNHYSSPSRLCECDSDHASGL